ncbi:hypothetical protein O97_00884 [Bartonella henselae str. Zeus]|nr:hypothetical protein Q653_00093 [Bartonella henselae JK 42]ETS15183.1 hypothetical protein Q652_00226 [Bartonella henselae JK 41]KEC57527.1 hypothetical protein O97_00884 [Bartonella henselae str. Zeus]KEC59917.1 hypothetical protein O95_00974 [Bartonella henselae JK 53]OLL52789.1 hypothetical protein AT238_07830 [Bartonella henselae]
MPLSSEVLKIIQQIHHLPKNDFILSFSVHALLPHSAMEKCIKQIEFEACPHRFRSNLHEVANRKN